MGKRVLIIGNGFDLAHGLPTSYSDFLDFAELFLAIYRRDLDFLASDYETLLSKWDGNSNVKKHLLEDFTYREAKRIKNDAGKQELHVTLKDSKLDSVPKLLDGNIWYKYLSLLHRKDAIRGKNWIDFESEISSVVQWLDKNVTVTDESFNSFGLTLACDRDTSEKNSIFGSLLKEEMAKTVEDFINRLYADLEDLTKALDIYLEKYVEVISIEKIEVIEKIKPDYIISFNYTHTYSKLYNPEAPICYIHGECGRTDKRCNMVIGIDEYLDGISRNCNTTMAIFKKFVQRIRKKNSVFYRFWHKTMLNEYEEALEWAKAQTRKSLRTLKERDYSEIVVYGHSLDITDKDILELFLKADYSTITVYAKGEMNEGKLISNMINIMTEEVLIEKSTVIPPRLNMVVI